MTDQRERALALFGVRLDALVLDLAREVHGPTAMERRARDRGDRFPTQMPVPLAGVSAAKQLARRVHREIVFHVGRARESGRSWDEIGEALGLTTRYARSRAEAAFESVAWRADEASAQTFGWRCTGCDRSISDRGPYNFHPEDNELGHAVDCPRLATDVEPSQGTAQERGIGEARSGSRSMRAEGVRHEPDSWAF